MAISLHPALDEDEVLLFQVYASTRADEMKLVDWTPEQKLAFLQMQYNAQRTHYQTYYPAATWHVIRRDDVPIGRLIVHRSPDDIELMDIALLPEYRKAGIGTALIRELQDEAAETGRVVRLYVETFNPALRLYERLGFRPLAESGFYLEMVWNPPGKRTGSIVSDQTTASRSA